MFDYRYLESLGFALQANNLVKKAVPPGPNSLGRSLSSALYYTAACGQDMLNASKKFIQDIVENKQELPKELRICRASKPILKQYVKNPTESQFDFLTMEVMSWLYKMKIIVYYMDDDYRFFKTTIINTRPEHTNTAELLRHTYGGEYEVVIPTERYDHMGICQNIVLNIVERIVNGTPATAPISFRNINDDKYINYEYNDWQSVSEGEPAKPPKERKRVPRFERIRSNSLGEAKGKRDLYSDKRANNESSEERNNAGLFLKGIAASNNRSGLSGIASVGKPIMSNRVFSFSKEMTERDTAHSGNQGGLSPVYFINTPPPGLTPNRYPNRSFTFNAQQQGRPNQQHYDKTGSQHTTAEKGDHAPAGLTRGTPSHINLDNKAMTPSKTLTFGQALATPDSKGERFASLSNFDSFPKNAATMSLTQLPLGTPSSEKKKPVILEESKERYTGKLKFFDEGKSYGFIIMDGDGSDIFVHWDDLSKASVTKDMLKRAKEGLELKFSFVTMSYMGKYQKSRKAVEVQLLNPEAAK